MSDKTITRRMFESLESKYSKFLNESCGDKKEILNEAPHVERDIFKYLDNGWLFADIPEDADDDYISNFMQDVTSVGGKAEHVTFDPMDNGPKGGCIAYKLREKYINESFWNNTPWLDMLCDIEGELGCDDWNTWAQDERDEFVKDAWLEFFKRYEEDDSLPPIDYRELFADLEDNNFHTEAKVLNNMLSSKSIKESCKVNESNISWESLSESDQLAAEEALDILKYNPEYSVEDACMEACNRINQGNAEPEYEDEDFYEDEANLITVLNYVNSKINESLNESMVDIEQYLEPNNYVSESLNEELENTDIDDEFLADEFDTERSLKNENH